MCVCVKVIYKSYCRFIYCAVQLKGTYLVIYGKEPVFIVMCALTVVGMLAAYCIDVHGLLWPLQLLLIGVWSL